MPIIAQRQLSEDQRGQKSKSVVEQHLAIVSLQKEIVEQYLPIVSLQKEIVE